MKVRASARTPPICSLLSAREEEAASRRRSAVAERSSGYGGHGEVAGGHSFLRMALRADPPTPRSGAARAGIERGGWQKNLKSRASRLAKPDARHHGSRKAADPAHKPASSVDAVRVPHGRRESAGGLSKDHDSSAGVVFVGAAGDGGGAGGWNEAAPQPQCQPGEGTRHEPAPLRRCSDVGVIARETAVCIADHGCACDPRKHEP